MKKLMWTGYVIGCLALVGVAFAIPHLDQITNWYVHEQASMTQRQIDSQRAAEWSTQHLANDVDKTVMGIIAMLVFTVCGVSLGVIWFLPGIIASRRKHRNAGAIWLLAILTGPTGIGWVAAIVWSVMNQD